MSKTATRLLSSRLMVAAIAAMATLVISGGVAVAAGALATTNVVNACYKSTAPYTLSVKKTTTCPTGTTPISWNKTGLTQFHTVTAQSSTIPAGNVGAIDVSCPTGQKAISGGYTVPFTVTVLESHPRADNAGVWTIVAAFPNTSGVITGYAQCARTS